MNPEPTAFMRTHANHFTSSGYPDPICLLTNAWQARDVRDAIHDVLLLLQAKLDAALLEYYTGSSKS